jgi:hypothetical protein
MCLSYKKSQAMPGTTASLIIILEIAILKQYFHIHLGHMLPQQKFPHPLHLTKKVDLISTASI